MRSRGRALHAGRRTADHRHDAGVRGLHRPGGPGAEPASPRGCGCARPTQTWLRAMPAMVGTAGLDWLLDFLGVGIDALGDLLEGTRPGAGGVSALPFLSASGERAPFVDTRARGQIEGVTLGTGRGDVVRAVCEGIAYTAKHCFERAASVRRRRGPAGGVRRRLAVRAVGADLRRRPRPAARGPRRPGPGHPRRGRHRARALGDDLDPAAWAAPSRTVEPSPHARECYADGYLRYRAHVDTARDFWARQAQGFAHRRRLTGRSQEVPAMSGSVRPHRPHRARDRSRQRHRAARGRGPGRGRRRRVLRRPRRPAAGQRGDRRAHRGRGPAAR